MITDYDFPTSRDGALERLKNFVADQALRYDEERNYVVPRHSNVSMLSTSICYGLISADEAVEQALREHPFEEVEKFIQEIYWRRYWKSWLQMRPSIWDEYRQSVEEMNEDAELVARCREVEEGRGPIEVMNGFAKELREKGYLHNHARMWFAGYWIHYMKLPWQMGTQFFYRYLLDGDPAVNTLSWRWVAGWQTPGKTYQASRRNIEKFLDDSELDGKRDSLALLDGHEVVRPEGAKRNDPEEVEFASETPNDSLRSGVWLHEDDLNGPTFSCDLKIVTRDLGMEEHLDFPKFKTDWLSNVFAHAAQKSSADLVETKELSNALLDWCKEHSLKQLVTSYPMIGYLNDEVVKVREKLSKEGISLVLMRTENELEYLNLARGGFFGFWKKIKKLKGWE